MPGVVVRRVTEVAAVVAVSDLFDGPARVEWAERFWRRRIIICS